MDVHWRNTQKTVRFFTLDARAAIPLFVCVLHFRPYTLAVSVIVVALFYIAERRGLTFEAAIRAFRVFIIGPKRGRLLFTKKRTSIEYDFSGEM
jgi:intracellular multiplication protein IcmT